MPLIGTRQHAEQILNAHRNGAIPAAFSRVGSGSYRVVYLHKETNVVYKVDTRNHCCDDCDVTEVAYSSKAELRNARALRNRQLKHVRIPAVSGFTINGELVLAMEYIKKVRSRPSDEALLELYGLRFADMHGMNFMVDAQGKIVPVDMASPRNSYPDLRCLHDMQDQSFYDAERQRRWGW